MLKSKYHCLSNRKLLCLLIVISLLLSVLPTAYAATFQTLNVNVGSATGEPGGTVTIPVSFQGVPATGINNFDFEIAYKGDMLEFVNVTPGNIITDFNENVGTFNKEDPGQVKVFYNDSTQGLNSIIKDGVCLNVVFKIKSSALPSIYQIGVLLSGNFNDKNMNEINDIKVNSGTITVKAPADATPLASGIIPVGTPAEGTVLPSGSATPTIKVTPTPTATSKPSGTVVKTPSKSTPIKIITTPIVVIDENLPFLPAGIPADLVVSVSADKNIYAEDEVINFRIKYLNRLDKAANNVTVTAQIPENTTLADAAGGTKNGNNIEWSIGNIANGKTGEITYKVKVGQLSKPQAVVSNTVTIDSKDNVLVNNDNKSTYKVMLYTDRLGTLEHKKYVEGYKDNTIKPDNQITRAEAAVMFAKILRLDISEEGSQVYADVPKSHWAFKYVNAASEAGLFKGYEGNVFKPNNPITRAEIATAIFRNLGLKEITPLETNFSDVIGHWAWGYVEEVYRLKLVNGYGNGLFKPNDKVKRCEVITMLNKMSYRGPLKGVNVSFKDLSPKHWAVGQIAESTTDHEYRILPEGGEEAVIPAQ